jgi:hypothetical protein
MTRRKDAHPEADQPQDVPLPTDPVAAEPFVVTDPVASPADEPAVASDPEPSAPPPPQVVVRRGSVFPPLLGGALAAIGGFALSHFDVLDLRPDTSADLAALSSQLTEVQAKADGIDRLAADIATVTVRLTTLESAPPPEAPDLSRLDTLEQRLSTIEAMPSDGAASTAAVTAKLAELERRLAAVPQGASPELQQQLDAALARLDEAEAAATARAEEAAAAATTAERAQALDALDAKVASGEPFGPELQALEDPALTEALSPLAEVGAPTLAQLQGAFPDAAREALRVARESSTDTGWGSRLVDFLASQTGARPLTPLEGDTPDAILSRADFALAEGRVADAVAELDPLDPTIKAALDPWLAQAQAHLGARAALQAARGE